MATFSWSDTFKIAFKSCSPCFYTHSEEEDASYNNYSEGHVQNLAINTIPRARPDELQGLLAEVTDTDVEAERMSLHSNPGSQRKRTKKKHRRKSKRTLTDNVNARRITLFGYNLFGRQQAVQLADDTEDAFYASNRTGPSTLNTQSTSSSSVFDSDAAPLEREEIAALSSPTTAAAAIEAAAKASADLEAQRLREKEERRRSRQERKEVKRVAAVALARQGITGDGEFEGFQGSGGAELPQKLLRAGRTQPSSKSDSCSDSRGSSSQQHGRPLLPARVNDDDDDDDGDGDDAADLDGGHYSRRSTAGSSNGGGSDSRSRTSASVSDRAPSSSASGSGSKPRKNKNKFSASRTAKSHSSTASHQTTSPLSPTASEEAAQVVSPSTIEQGQGFFDLDAEAVSLPKPESSYTPITGFSSGASRGRKNSVGVFLAQRGGDNLGR